MIILFILNLGNDEVGKMINKSNSLSKALRILSIFERLNQGAVIKKGDEAKRFNEYSLCIRVS